jgi:hypothetical protein
MRSLMSFTFTMCASRECQIGVGNICCRFITHFIDDDISHVKHRLQEERRTKALQRFMETPEWHAFSETPAYIDFMHAHPSRNTESK